MSQRICLTLYDNRILQDTSSAALVIYGILSCEILSAQAHSDLVSIYATPCEELAVVSTNERVMISLRSGMSTGVF